jgi:hypothetical protein
MGFSNEKRNKNNNKNNNNKTYQTREVVGGEEDQSIKEDQHTERVQGRTER